MKALILDIDGTLWDTTEVVAKAWNEAIFDIQGKQTLSITSARLKKEFGKPMWEIARNLFPKESEKRQQDIMDRCCEYEEEALMQCKEDLLYKDVKKTLISLHEKTKLFIVSNCQDGYIPVFLKSNQLEAYITDYTCSGETGRPKGENIALLMERNHLQASDCVYVGDTQGDLLASEYAGVPFVFASYGFGQPDHYDAKLSCFADLLQCECIF